MILRDGRLLVRRAHRTRDLFALGRIPQTNEEAVPGAAQWARGYLRCNSGNLTDEIVAQYIVNQDVNGG